MKKYMLLNLLFAAGTLMSCHSDALLEPEIPEISIDTNRYVKNYNAETLKRNYVNGLIRNEIVVSDTILKYVPVKLHQSPEKAPDLSNLKSKNLPGSPLEYIAIGSSLTAGVRDGGYTNEGMLTSYPALIARQMKLARFESPLFDEPDYNGAGKKVITTFNPTKGPVKKLAVAANNLAIEGYDEKTGNVILRKSRTPYNQLHNLALPELSFEFTDRSSTWTMPYLKRISLDGKQIPQRGWDLLGNIKERKIDFFTMEMGSQAFGGDDMDISGAGETIMGKYMSWEQEILEKYAKEGVKGVVANLPNFWNFPHYNQFPCELIEQNSLGVYKIPDCAPGKMMGGSSAIDSLASPVVSLSLKENYRSFLSGSYDNDRKLLISAVLRYNQIKGETHKKFGFPLVDLYSLYERILKGELVTQDGIKVDPSWPEGNFFSQDGIYPTAFGHAIIANEIIKVINNHYKTRIPLINTREYIK
jgi:hypothetical protein